MPRNCCVPGCKSNYSKDGPLVPIFIFPKDKLLREKWIRCINREHFTPSKHSAVCIRHFAADFVIREDKFHFADGSFITLPRKRIKLEDGAFPTIFENQPSYLSKQLPPKRKDPSERMNQVCARGQQQFEEWNERDNISGYCELLEKLKSRNVSPFIIINRPDSSYISLCKIDDTCVTEPPKVTVCIKIMPSLAVHVFHNNAELPRKQFEWCLGDELMCNKWTKFDCLLSHVAAFEEENSNGGRKQSAMKITALESGKVEALSLFEVKHEIDDFAAEDLPPVEPYAKETVFLQIKEEPTEFVDMGEPPAELIAEGLEFSKIKEEPIETSAVDSIESELKEEEFEFLPVKRELTSKYQEEYASKIKLENPLVKEEVSLSGKTSMAEKGVYGKWTTEQLSLAVVAYLNGHYGLNECSRKYRIPKSTLKRHAEFRNIKANGDVKRFGRIQTFSSDIETELEKHILSLAEDMFVVRPTDVRKFAFQIAEKNGIPHTFNAKVQMAGKKWYYKFMERHPRLTSVIQSRGLKKFVHT